MNVPNSISSTPGVQPSLPIILCILSVLNSVSSACDKWWIFVLIRSLSITCGSDSVSHWIEATLGILFQYFAFVGRRWLTGLVYWWD